MKTLFIILGLIMAISLTALVWVMIGLLFTNWPPLLYIAKALFLTGCISAVIFIITLVLIPHGKISKRDMK